MRPDLLPTLLGLAWLVPLVSFTLILFFGPRMGKHGIGAGYVATGAIVFSAILSQISLFGIWNWGDLIRWFPQRQKQKK